MNFIATDQQHSVEPGTADAQTTKRRMTVNDEKKCEADAFRR